MIRNGTLFLAAAFLASGARGEEPATDLARKLASAAVELYAEAPGYAEGPVWRDGDLVFCSGALLRVDAQKRVTTDLDISPAGTFRRGNGHLLICDNKTLALLDLSPEGKVGVVAERFEDKPLNSLNDLTVDKAGNFRAKRCIRKLTFPRDDLSSSP